MKYNQLLLSSLTTIKTGGICKNIVSCYSIEDFINTVHILQKDNVRYLVLGGGSNILFSDYGYRGVIFLLKFNNIQSILTNKHLYYYVDAGVLLDDFIKLLVDNNINGLEMLSGIPGTIGAAPIRNVGAYAQNISEKIDQILCFDTYFNKIRLLNNDICCFKYRYSIFLSNRYIILRVIFKFDLSNISYLSQPIVYKNLLNYMSIDFMDRVELKNARDSVLALRRSKGMVIDVNDINSYSLGSFFINPIIPLSNLKYNKYLYKCIIDNKISYIKLKSSIKISAASLIEYAGFYKGYQYNKVNLSYKHVLAIINPRNGNTKDIIGLANHIILNIYNVYGIVLVPEPILIDVKL